jgi:hypothetical protein
VPDQQYRTRYLPLMNGIENNSVKNVQTLSVGRFYSCGEGKSRAQADKNQRDSAGKRALTNWNY